MSSGMEYGVAYETDVEGEYFVEWADDEQDAHDWHRASGGTDLDLIVHRTHGSGPALDQDGNEVSEGRSL